MKESTPSPSSNRNGHSTNGHHIEGFPLPEVQTTEPASFPREAAERLHKALAEKRKIMRPPSIGAWAETIRLFLISSEIEKARFQKILGWYVKHIGEQFVPLACSAQSFCDKIVQIEHQMEIAEEDGELVDSEPEVKPIITRTMNAEESREWLRKREEEEWNENKAV